MDLYPLIFKPIIIEKIWGGEKLRSLLKKEISSENAGESWEISGVENNLSIVLNGPLKGKNIQELSEQYKDLLLGEKVYKTFREKFPLLIKFIDAKDDLSVQVHPDDNTAKKRHGKYGKNEMWYMLDCDPDSNLILGVNKDISKQEYIEHVEKKTISNVLNKITVQKGDAAFIPAGRIHAIMKGVFLAEIQQTSDITYRIYDWDRPGLDGSFRELHTEEAKDVVELEQKDTYLINYDRTKTHSELIKNKYFTVNRLNIEKIIKKNYATIDSFIIYMIIDGNIQFNYNNYSLIVSKGETVLIPASIKEVEIIPAERSELLEIYI